MSKSKSSSSSTSKAAATTPDWQVVENVIAAIERSACQVPGMTVTQKAQLPRLLDSTDRRDVDVLVEVPAGPRKFRVAIEVKNRSRPLSIDQMGCLVDLRRDIAVDRFCVVSTSGFSDGARKKATENQIEISTLEEFERSDFWKYPPATRVVHSGGEILHARFEFDAETIERDGDRMGTLVRGLILDDVLLADQTGTAPLSRFLSAVLHEYTASTPAAQVHGQVVQLRIDMQNYRQMQVSIRGEAVPTPTMIIATVKIIREVEVVPERRFRMGDVEVTTSEIEMFGTDRQVTLLAQPLPDGSRQLKMSVGPTRPVRTQK